LDEKMDMILIDSDFEEMDIIAMFYFQTDILYFLIGAFDFGKCFFAVFGWANQVIDEEGPIVRSFDMF